MLTGRSAARVYGPVLPPRAPSPPPRSDGSEQARTQSPACAHVDDPMATQDASVRPVQNMLARCGSTHHQLR
eukprot:31915-Prymnesium_polylepis.2